MGLKNEQSWHRMAAYMLLAGRTNSEIAAAAGVMPGQVVIVRAQRWFQQLLGTLANEVGQDVLGVIQAEALASVETLVSIRDDRDASNKDRLAAAQHLLEQSIGKPTQKVVSSVRHGVLGPPEQEMADVLSELKALRDRRSE